MDRSPTQIHQREHWREQQLPSLDTVEQNQHELPDNKVYRESDGIQEWTSPLGTDILDISDLRTNVSAISCRPVIISGGCEIVSDTFDLLQDPTFLTRPMVSKTADLLCVFRNLDCNESFSDIREFKTHVFAHFRGHQLPAYAPCFDCGIVFTQRPEDDNALAWNNMLTHMTYDHYRSGQTEITLEHSTSIMRYMWNRGIISNNDFKRALSIDDARYPNRQTSIGSITRNSRSEDRQSPMKTSVVSPIIALGLRDHVTWESTPFTVVAKPRGSRRERQERRLQAREPSQKQQANTIELSKHMSMQQDARKLSFMEKQPVPPHVIKSLSLMLEFEDKTFLEAKNWLQLKQWLTANPQQKITMADILDLQASQPHRERYAPSAMQDLADSAAPTSDSAKSMQKQQSKRQEALTTTTISEPSHISTEPFMFPSPTRPGLLPTVADTVSANPSYHSGLDVIGMVQKLKIKSYGPDASTYSPHVSNEQWNRHGSELRALHRMGYGGAEMLQFLRAQDFNPSMGQLNAKMTAWGFKVYGTQSESQDQKQGLKAVSQLQAFDGSDMAMIEAKDNIAGSVYSIDSVGSSLDLTKDSLQEFISYFGDILIEKAGARTWAASAVIRHESSEFDQLMEDLLEQFSLDLISDAADFEEKYPQTSELDKRIDNTRLSRSAARLIQRCGLEISSYFRERSLWALLDYDSITSRLKDSGKESSLREKLGLFVKEDSTLKELSEHEIEGLSDVGGGSNVKKEFGDLELIGDFLTSGNAFRKLSGSLRSLYYNGHSAMNRVRKQINDGLSTVSALRRRLGSPQTSSGAVIIEEPFHNIQVDIDWDLQAFISNQFGTLQPSIASMVVLVGSALYAQATTYSQYLERVWPVSGPTFLKSLQAAIESSTKEKYTSNRQIVDNCIIYGTKDFLIEVAQMLAFTGAVFKKSPYDEKLTYCKVNIEVKDGLDPNFQMTFWSEQLHSSEDCCWLSLFCGASIARDFPIPERGDELGLEISVDMMAAIAGVRHAVEYEGSVVMKGFSSMFVPVTKDETRVQWHLVTSGDCDTRLPYHEALQRCPKRATLDVVGLDDLRTTRAIVGWCNTAWSALGSSMVDYDTIEFSTAQQTTAGVKMKGGSLGFQQFGLAQVDFSLGAKDGKCHFQRTGGPYKRIISAAEKTPVALYDTTVKRAWLVPATEVMLHMTHHRHWLEPFEVNEQPICLPATNADGATAKKILLANANMDLSDTETYKLKDTITSIWSLLEFLTDQRVCQNQEPGVNPHLTLQDVLHGFEFKAVVQERSPFRPKQISVSKTSGGWPTLVKDIDALVLFAGGFGELIRSVRGHTANRGLCHMWATVPKERDYLCTSVNILTDLYDTAGYRLDRTFLTPTHLQWDRGTSTLFEPCTAPEAYICECNRLQQVVKKSAIGRVNKPEFLVESGAVIFGQCESPFHALSSSPKKAKACGIYEQPNTTFELSTSILDDVLKFHPHPLPSSTTYSEFINCSYNAEKEETMTNLTICSTSGTSRSIDVFAQSESPYCENDLRLSSTKNKDIDTENKGCKVVGHQSSDEYTHFQQFGLDLVSSNSLLPNVETAKARTLHIEHPHSRRSGVRSGQC